MIAIIGYPGESKHTWRRFEPSERQEAIAWLNAEGERLSEEHPAWSHNARATQRLISEREAAKIRWRDGRKCYPATP